MNFANPPGYMMATPSKFITVSEVERLAKAGVKLDWKDIAHQVTSDPPPPRRSPWEYPSENDLMGRLAYRMRWGQLGWGQLGWEGDGFGEPHPKIPHEYMSACKSGDKVFVFAVVGGKPTVIEDEWKMFPSDTLVTQLRILEGK